MSRLKKDLMAPVSVFDFIGKVLFSNIKMEVIVTVLASTTGVIKSKS